MEQLIKTRSLEVTRPGPPHLKMMGDNLSEPGQGSTVAAATRQTATTNLTAESIIVMEIISQPKISSGVVSTLKSDLAWSELVFSSQD